MSLKPWREEAPSPEEARARDLLAALEKAPVPEPPPMAAVQQRIAVAARAALWGRRALTGAAVVSGLAAAVWFAASRSDAPIPPAPPLLVAPHVVTPAVPAAPEPPAPAPIEPPRELPKETSRAVALPAPAVETREGGRGARGLARPLLKVAEPPAAPGPAPVPEAPVVEAKAPPPTESTLGEEARLMAAALGALRHDKNPASALEVLARYRARFPAGVLRPESVLIEAEALRALGRRAEALSALGAVTPAEAGQLALEMAVVTAELRAETGELAQAEQGFAQALAAGATGTLAERAEFGRARCAAQIGEKDAPRLLDAYLQHWPHGHFRAEAAERLERAMEPPIPGP